jgi:ATPase family associated with various cellular activities (AAA)
MNTKVFTDAPDVDAICSWATAFIDLRISSSKLSCEEIILQHPFPEISSQSAMGVFVETHQLTAEAKALLNLLFAYTVNYEVFDPLVVTGNGWFLAPLHGRYAPTVYTFMRLLGGQNMQKRLDVLELFRPQHAFNKRSILHIGDIPDGLPEYSGVIKFTDGIFDMFSTNVFQAPRFGPGFPAELVVVKEEFEDLLVNDFTKEELQLVKSFTELEYRMRFEYGFDKQLPQGYRVLLSGPPGTGKTMAAGIIAKQMNREMYRIDISRVASKYIGETEKNLSRLFDMAEGKGWILFFDEADALFGARVSEDSDNAGTAHRNDLVSYLLQRIENYNGIIFASTNLPKNMDVALRRRFHENIVFVLPDHQLMAVLWQKYLPQQFQLSKISLEIICRQILPPAAVAKICNKLLHRMLAAGQTEIPIPLLEKLIKDERVLLAINF